MMIKLRVRTNKIPSNGLKVMNDEFMIFDHVSEVRYGRAKPCTKEEFTRACPVTRAEMLEYGNPTTFDGTPIKQIRWMVKDTSCCEPDEKYHYNVIEWVNDKTKEAHRLTYDTILFLQDDSGKTLEKIQG
jgi:hypothetical protein